MTLPRTSLWTNLEVSARRFPDKPAIVFYDSVLTYRELERDALRLAGFLQHECGVRRGDRVALYMCNCPQFVIAYYAVLRADAMVVPVNPMNRTGELAHIVEDSGAQVIVAAQELFGQLEPLLGRRLRHAVISCHADYLTRPTDLAVPQYIAAPRQPVSGTGVTAWHEALARGYGPDAHRAGADDLCVLPYTSGTTGAPKGCIHRHRNAMHTLVSLALWHGVHQDDRSLSVLPFFHVTGMQNSMNVPIYAGGTAVILARWDREVAATLIQRYRITRWTSVPTMVIDLISSPNIGSYDLSSLRTMGGGGAAMPQAVAQRLRELCGVTYIEGYGLSETMAPTHINPEDRPKSQCLGIPIFDTDSRIVDHETLAELPPGEAGEIVTHGPQVFEGYWNNPQESGKAFVTIDGKRFLRTGDLGRMDEDGYFFFVDRLKRMINAAGFKVWPAEVEAQLHAHPAVQEAVVVGTPDERRGESVKAIIVPKPETRGRVSAEEIIEWARQNMAAYKVPRVIEFAESLPKSATGKVMWRVLQEREYRAAREPQA